MEFEDRELPCRDCGRMFVWTAGEQHFFHEKALSNIPVRCSGCRSARKARMGLQDRAQTEVVCADCGQKTTVPFVPRNGNPVYCARCFDRQKAGIAAQVVSVAT
jgi:CxxC-x17-CxxC domain-containing protein